MTKCSARIGVSVLQVNFVGDYLKKNVFFPLPQELSSHTGASILMRQFGLVSPRKRAFFAGPCRLLQRKHTTAGTVDLILWDSSVTGRKIPAQQESSHPSSMR